MRSASQPKISVITVCYNSAAHIADCLRSVDAQTWQNVEHIVVDGASNDATMDIIAAHPKLWRRVLSEPDKGIYDAMNKGLKMATGDIVGFINSDDFYSSPTVLEKVAAALSDTSADACYADLCYVDQHDVNSIVRYWRSSAFVPGLFLRGWCPAHPTFYVRGDVFERFGGFDTRYRIAADVELMARFLEVHRISTRYIPEVLVKMRTGGTTNRSVTNIIRQNHEIWRALRSHGLKPSMVTFIANKIFSRGRQFFDRPA